MDKLDLSVVICTYTLERWNDLLAAMKSLRNQTSQPLEIIIVVDHNPDLLDQVTNEFPDAIVVENRGPMGLSGARNSGLAIAKGQLIGFFDDDEVLDPQCLTRLSNWFRDPAVLGAGGKIVPNWISVRPGWFPEEFGWVLGYSYKGLPQGASPVRNLIGGNMCFRRMLFEQVGGFRDGIGRINKHPLGCEETELCIRALQHWPEGTLIYDPEAIVYHRTPPERANWHYFLERCFYEGVSKATISRFVGADDGLSSERQYTLRVLPRGVFKGMLDSLVKGDRSGMARSAAILAGLSYTAAGYLFGSFMGLRERLQTSLRKKAVKGAT